MDQQEHQARIEQLKDFVHKAGLQPNEHTIWLANNVIEKLNTMQQDEVALQQALDHHRINTTDLEAFYQELEGIESHFEGRVDAIKAKEVDIQERAQKQGWKVLASSVAGAVIGFFASGMMVRNSEMKPLAKGAVRTGTAIGGGIAGNLINQQVTIKPLERERESLKGEAGQLVQEYEEAMQGVLQKEVQVKQQVIESLAVAMLKEAAGQAKQHAPAQANQHHAPRHNAPPPSSSPAPQPQAGQPQQGHPAPSAPIQPKAAPHMPAPPQYQQPQRQAIQPKNLMNRVNQPANNHFDAAQDSRVSGGEVRIG